MGGQRPSLLPSFPPQYFQCFDLASSVNHCMCGYLAHMWEVHLWKRYSQFLLGGEGRVRCQRRGMCFDCIYWKHVAWFRLAPDVNVLSLMGQKKVHLFVARRHHTMTWLKNEREIFSSRPTNIACAPFSSPLLWRKKGLNPGNVKLSPSSSPPLFTAGWFLLGSLNLLKVSSC